LPKIMVIRTLPKIMVITLLIMYIAATTITAYALTVTERGVISRIVKGSSDVSFELEVGEVPQGYGVKITSDLDSLSMQPKDVENYEFKDDTLLIYPPIKKFSVKISGKTPPSYFEENYRNLVFTDLNKNEYLYYHVIIINETGAECKKIGEKKKSFVLKNPEYVVKVREKMESIENEKLKEVAEDLFEVGLVDFADKLASAGSKGGFSLFHVIVVGVIAFLGGLYIGYLFKGLKSREKLEP